MIIGKKARIGLSHASYHVGMARDDRAFCEVSGDVAGVSAGCLDDVRELRLLREFYVRNGAALRRYSL